MPDITPDKIALARKWAEAHVKDGYSTIRQRAAAEVIASLPDEWIDAEKLREIIVHLRADMDFNPDLEPHVEALESLLPTPTPRTMADVEWNDDEHAGLCAQNSEAGIVRMLFQAETQICCLSSYSGVFWKVPSDLTPIPGTRVDLSPTSEPECEDGPEEYREFMDFIMNEPVTIIDTPPTINDAPPTTLTTVEDYENAPSGTVVWGRSSGSHLRTALEKWDHRWHETGVNAGYEDDDMERHGPHQILRWGDA